ncbi:MAG TPA: hypothetical protein VK186_17545 [Candidatus Deferrimicrobium sp.]|nr:hypothetical protein [Candidatus Deferrimicrobium sp.]
MRKKDFMRAPAPRAWSSFFKSLKKSDSGEPPPILKSWRNLYFVVLANLLFWIVLFTLFTWMFK